MAQAVAYFTGFETGDASEIVTLSAGASIQTGTVRTGGYALKNAAGATTLKSGLAATQSIIRAYVNFTSFSSSTPGFFLEESSAAFRLLATMQTSGIIKVQDNGSSLGLTGITDGTTVLSVGTWYVIEMAIDLAANGVVKLWINGALEISTTHTSDVTAAPTDKYAFIGRANPNEAFFDDVRIDTGGVAQIGAGRTIARQGTAGTPTYNAWTKNGAATAALCWSDTPFATGTNCSDNVLNDAQTMLAAPFSAIQSGHGTEVIGSGDTINACKVAAIAKTAVAGNLNIRRRVGGADTDVTVAITTADAYYDTGIFTDTVANLDSYEIGAKNDLVGTAETVEDMWLMVDFTVLELALGASMQFIDRRGVQYYGAQIVGAQ